MYIGGKEEMTKICRICGKEFEPRVYNATICYNTHTTNCRICNKEICLDGEKNKLKKKMYLQKGYAYCSHLCSCQGIALDKRLKIEENVDMDKLKYYIEETPKPFSEIAKLLNVPVDFVHSRAKIYNLVRSDELKEQSRQNKNQYISAIIKEKYKDNETKNKMLERARNTYKARTGYDISFHNPESIEKSRQTKLARYCNPTFTNPEKMILTRKTNNNGNFWTQEQIQQSIKTKIELYGNTNNVEKIMETNLKNHGVKWWTNPEKIKETWNKKSKEEKQAILEKQNNTKLERYGNLNNYEKCRQTNLKRYGYDNPFKNPEIRERINKTNLKKYGTIHPVTLFSYMNGITISKINKKTNEQLIRLGCKTQLEKSVNNSSYDIFVEPNTLIEINPSYTHNSTIGPFMFGRRVEPKSYDYHINKTNNAIKNNYRCIHIFDWDNIDKIINSFCPKQTIYARNCEIREVDLKECRTFLNNYHFQGSCNKQNIRLGLYYKNILVEIITFGKPRYNKNYEYELLRLCTKPEYKIVGGTNKLFNYFIKQYNPSSIVSYCDISKFSGDVYTTLGFTLKNKSKPNKHWYNLRTKRHITNNLLLQRGFSQLHNDNNYEMYKKGDSNEELMYMNGYVVVYDCGQNTYVWHKQKER